MLVNVLKMIFMYKFYFTLFVTQQLERVNRLVSNFNLAHQDEYAEVNSETVFRNV